MKKQNSKVFVLDGSRTPIGSLGRSLRSVPIRKLTSHAMTNALRRTGVAGGQLDGVILGHGYQSAYDPNTARVSAQEANIPDNVHALTVQRQCGSGMQAVNDAARMILLGEAELMLAGGSESMSTIPYIYPGKYRWQGPFAKWFKMVGKGGPRPVLAALLDSGMAPMKMMWDMNTLYMSGTAQLLADTYGISRQAMDEYSLRSQELAAAAIASGRFAEEIDPIQTSRGFLINDEHPRKTSAEKLAKLRGVLRTRDITAGNSSGINDGACMLVVASEGKVQELGADPLVELVDWSVVGLDPKQMGLGPVLAINKLLENNGLTLDDIDLIEINEAFAAQYLACEKLLGLDRDKVNVNGGAIALGHPIGMTGARVIQTLGYELRRRGLKRGIASLCIGGGMGIATLIERP